MQIKDYVTTELHSGVWQILGVSNAGFILGQKKLKVVVKEEFLKPLNKEVKKDVIQGKFTLKTFVTASEKFYKGILLKLISYDEYSGKYLCKDKEGWYGWIEQDKLTKYIFKTKKL